MPAIASADTPNRDVTIEPVGAAFGAYAAEYEQAFAAQVSAFAEVSWLDGIQPPDTMQRFSGAGARVGARWFDLSLGIGVELNASNLEGTMTDQSAPFQVQPMPRASLGVAF